MDNAATAFVDPASTDYASIARTVIGLKPRALTPPQYEDVVTLIEWMQAECVHMHEFNEQRSKQLDEQNLRLNDRVLQITAREKELRVRARTIDTAVMTQHAGSKFMRYLRR